MAISPINVSRVSQQMRTNFVINSLRQNQVDLFKTEAQIATGRAFVAASDNPLAASRVLDLDEALQQQQQFATNLLHADNTLAAADTAITEVNTLLIEAASIASENVSNLTSAAERLSVADLIAGIRAQLQSVGNRQFNDRFLFAGRDTLEVPFVSALGGIAYAGDTGDLLVRVGEQQSDVINIPGNVLFGALSSRVGSAVDLSPRLTGSMRLEDFGGASNSGLRDGTLVIYEENGAGTIGVDITPADTIADVVDLINEAAEAAGAGFVASLSDTGINVAPGGNPISITDRSSGIVASDLGIRTSEPTTDLIEGQDLRARVTRLTLISDLALGDGIDTENGFTITNGPKSATIDLSAAETVQDIINAINGSELFVLARITEDGTGIEVFNQVSGVPLTIGENGGTTATDLGIRTFDESILLSDINFGRGVFTIEGKDDFRITAKDGSPVDVNLDGATTIGDVIALINEAATDAGVSIEASLAATGNGIRIEDSTGGSGRLVVSPLNQSESAANLGLLQTIADTETELIGDDTNPIRTEGVLDALVDLENALRRDDTQGITLAAGRIPTFIKEVTGTHGVVGARSRAMRAKLQQMNDASQTTGIFLSEIRDLDYAEAITRLQSGVTQLQVSMQTSATLLNMSLMDFLR